MRRTVPILLMMTTWTTARAEPISFEEVREVVFREPLSRPPDYGHPELRMLLNGLSGAMFHRFYRTFQQDLDLKPWRTKLAHRVGVCADARWKIDGVSPATGLLDEGADIPALVRFAVGNNRPTPGPVPRIFSMAVKLFPTSDPRQAVETRNLHLFDQYAIDGDYRGTFLSHPPSGEHPLAFSNLAPVSKPHALLTTVLLAPFSPHPLTMPLYPLTEVDGTGARVMTPVTPHHVLLIPRPTARKVVARDFRDELRRYAPGELVFDVVIPRQPRFPESVAIGTLTVGHMVVSEACDATLHFRHHPWR
ncbi:MAG: hypothetical protein AB2A00_02505 [Myxococcota bacterium]